MNTKYLFTGIAIIVVIIAAFLLMNQTSAPTEISNQNNPVENANSTEAVTNNDTTTNSNRNSSNLNTNTAAVVKEEPTEPDGNDIAVFEINYDGTTFNPSQLTIKAGDVVIFKNNSSGSFWPASGPHPGHTAYPEFDPKKAIGAGQSWQFKFTKTGNWPFHDHINPSVFGKIIVE